jgi:ubiquinone/menaquinone biosynthesis C-methylase UbiE
MPEAISSTETLWDLYARSYDNILSLMEYYQEVLRRHISFLDAPEIDNIIDLGAGTGTVALKLAGRGHHVVAVDSSGAMLDRLKAKREASNGRSSELSVELFNSSAEDLERFEDASFDGVNILLALFAMKHPAKCLYQAIRILKPGGRLILTEPRRVFDMKVLLAKAEAFLKEKQLLPAWQDDWNRVKQVNCELKDSMHPGMFPVEVIEEELRATGGTISQIKQSHFGNCATIWFTKDNKTPKLLATVRGV